MATITAVATPAAAPALERMAWAVDGLNIEIASWGFEANACLWDAFNTDVRPLLAELRVARGLPADPYRGYLASGEEDAKYAARVGGTAASW